MNPTAFDEIESVLVRARRIQRGIANIVITDDADAQRESPASCRRQHWHLR